MRGSTVAPSTGESEVIAIRSARGSSSAWLANGMRDGVAHATSPSAWPARTSSATAVSRVVRETTPSTPRNE